MRVLFIIPPLTQFNSPYPSTAYLTAHLAQLNHSATQFDLSLELTLKIFSQDGLKQIKNQIKNKKNRSDSLNFFLDASNDYINTVEEVIQFLQGNKPDLKDAILSQTFMPEGPRFVVFDEQVQTIPEHLKKFSDMDLAKYRASLYMDDIADFISEGIDSDYGFSRYGEKLASSMNSFSPLYKRILKEKTLLDSWIEELTLIEIKEVNPDVVGFSIPFPGNLLGGLISAKVIKEHYPQLKIIMGGGFVNTELRSIEDKRLFEFIDYLTFDDGEKPLEFILEMLAGKRSEDELLRTYYLKNNQIKKVSNPKLSDPAFKNLARPSFKDLDFNRYISMMEMPNFVHRLWSDGKWNKLILAHGCYWKKCTFCDVSLDYIGRFDPDRADAIVTKMEEIKNETGSDGFHFVDEAAPPALLEAISEEIIKRNLKFRWWGNIRFDTYFDSEVCLLMKRAGCIAVTGGIEVASPRVLELINKGIDLESVEKVTSSFKKADIFVHAYLMYGFPTQTVQETIDSLETVRRLFQKGNLSSAFWHRFAATVHSPVGLNPSKFNIKIPEIQKPKEGLFAINEVPFIDSIKTDHDMLGRGLRKALYNYMLGLGLDLDVREWFEAKVPKTTLKT